MSRSRKITILTAGIHGVFRGLKFLVDADIGKKGHFRSGTKYGFVYICLASALIILQFITGFALTKFIRAS